MTPGPATPPPVRDEGTSSAADSATPDVAEEWVAMGKKLVGAAKAPDNGVLDATGCGDGFAAVYYSEER